jgi:hypothetical protein
MGCRPDAESPRHPTIDSSKMPIKGLHEHTRLKNSVDEFLGNRQQEATIRMLMIAGWQFRCGHFDQQTRGPKRFELSSVC